jgi:hypothetical protein
MSFLRVKKIKGKSYFYLVENVREGAQVRQRIVRYYGDTCPQANQVLLLRLLVTLRRELTRRKVAIILKEQKPTKGRYGKGKNRYDPVLEITWAGGKTILTESMELRALRTILKLLFNCP